MDTLTKELTAVWRKLGRMLTTGVPLLRALRSIIQETSNEQVRASLADVVNAVESGSSFHAALSRHSDLFPPSVLTLAHSGEMTGTLERSAMAIADGLGDGSFGIGLESASLPDAVQAQDPDEPDLAERVTRLLAHALDSRASDIHISMAGEKPRVRIRVDGNLTDQGVPAIPPEMFAAVTARIKRMAGMSAVEKQRPQDGRIQIHHGGKEFDLRVNVTPCATGESLVLRVVPQVLSVPRLEDQGFLPEQLDQLRSWMRRPNGILVVSGPTGSGKTTTLYSVLAELNTPGRKVMSVEDPIECRIDGVDQVQVRPSVGITFACALRSILRQDPDIILNGEIRDLETAQISVQAALTGHLVLTTLHTNDAPSAVRRLIDVGLPPFLVSSALIGVMTQRLLRKICLNCKEEYTPDPGVLERVRRQFPLAGKPVRGRGCEACRHTGYRGRTAVHEMLEVSGDLRALVHRDPTGDELYAQAVRSGMRTLLQDAVAKVEQGITTVEEALLVCR